MLHPLLPAKSLIEFTPEQLFFRLLVRLPLILASSSPGLWLSQCCVSVAICLLVLFQAPAHVSLGTQVHHSRTLQAPRAAHVALQGAGRDEAQPKRPGREQHLSTASCSLLALITFTDFPELRLLRSLPGG